MVLKCRACIQERQNPREPLVESECPARPWQKLGTDLFVLKGKTYLVVVDYFSRYVEVAQLSNTKSTDIIVQLKSIFARHGIPEELMSDNGPQFSGQDFTQFADTYGFRHITSSPKFPQSNGEAGCAVQTAKGLLKKASDPYLLAYRTTPLQSGFSPAQLLMGRRLRTTVPTLPSRLDPAVPSVGDFVHKERAKKELEAERYNRRHCAKLLSDLVPEEHVWVTDAKESGTVLQNHTSPRSYLVNMPKGVVRRNRQHLIPLLSHASDGDVAEQQELPETNNQQVSTSPGKTPETLPTGTATLRTRSGRAVVKPERLNL
uniref:Integrase catalytic domain-containing protein n=1 Tax=Monopterus albus TaxID=43700 RepID=A0A3Q3ISC0_MONAL